MALLALTLLLIALVWIQKITQDSNKLHRTLTYFSKSCTFFVKRNLLHWVDADADADDGWNELRRGSSRRGSVHVKTEDPIMAK